MTTIVDTDLLGDLQKFGAADVNACFSCGNCTALCPLSDNDATFPRRMIRYAQVGLTDELLGSKELWTCYHCGLCSDSCPTEADPGEFMAAARRYAVASYDPTGLARILYTRPVVGTALAVGIAAFFALFMYAASGPQDGSTLALFEFISEDLIHWTGIGVMIALVVAGAIGVVRMARHVARRDHVSLRSVIGGRAALARTARAAWSSIGVESLGQRRFREDCKDDAPAEPLYRRRWLIHALTIWGFLGLFAATLMDWGLALLGIKETGTAIPIWYPSRLLGTIAGISLVYGVTIFMINRARRLTRSAQTSTASDWLLLALLWITGVTGFAIEIALYQSGAPAWGYWVFLFHVAVAMELMLLLPFTKFAHAMYRPVALFFLALAKEPRPQEA
ncbi:4Fe-4S dicluster domain-containing protein [Actinotalea sp.]|uniref:4Fe-4S dicluster domain-containing protein n=1 Tax=Actinotalea sp. TaxID=1872145 RepID=UPI003566503A